MINRLFISIVLILGSTVGALSAEKAKTDAAAIAARVACVGDSITFGFGIADREHNSYPAKLATLLGPRAEVRNFGVNGATALKHGTRPYSDQQAYRDALAFKPQLVVIMLGTNDTNKKSWPDHHDEFADDYLALVRSFREANPAVQVWLCTPPPLFRDRGADWDTDAILKNQVVPKINETARQTKCKVIDVYALFAEKPAVFSDGVHPNGAGAELLAREIDGKLKPQLTRKTGDK